MGKLSAIPSLSEVEAVYYEFIAPRVNDGIETKSLSELSIACGMAHMLDMLCVDGSPAEEKIRSHKRKIQEEIRNLLTTPKG